MIDSAAISGIVSSIAARIPSKRALLGGTVVSTRSHLFAWIVLTSVIAENHAFARDDATLGDAVDRYVAAAVDAGHLSGSLLVARGDAILLERCFGLADLEHAVPITSETRFVIASITKEMTFALAVRLAERRKLGLDDPLSKYAPDFPRGDRITVLHLMQHRAGIPHRVAPTEARTRPVTAAEMLAFAAAATPLPFEPGEKSVYSSAGYSMLARVLEIAGEKPFAELLAEYIFTPANMERTLDANARDVVADRAESSFLGPQGVEHAPLKDLSFLVGAGSVLSTPRDLHRLQRAFLDGSLGESVRQSSAASGPMRWNGSTNGYLASADHDPATDLHIVFCANRATGAVARLREALPRIVAGEDVPPLEVPSIEPALIAIERHAPVFGRYRDASGTEIELRELAGQVVAGDVPLVPRGETEFFAPSDYGRLTFEHAEGPGTPIDALVWESATFRSRFERVR